MPWRDLFQHYGRVMDELEQRKARITQALTTHNVPYALIGGQAVIAWVSTIDPDAVRTTKDIDILLRREDLAIAKRAAASVDFDYFEVLGVGMFVDRVNPSPKRAVHIVWANELVRPGETVPAPPIEAAAVLGQGQSVVSLEWLVIMKLTAWRLHDQVHLQDLIDVRLVDATWISRLTPELAMRLQSLLDSQRR
jgi:hypothetical protein